MAITGPFSRSRSYSTGSTQWWTKYQWWYRQSAPYKEPLAFKMNYNRFLWALNPGLEAGSTPQAYSAGTSPAYANAYNKAYAKFKDKVSEAASMAVNVAERKEAMDMMTKRVMQVYRFARAIGRYDFAGAGSVLGLELAWRKGSTYAFKRSKTWNNATWARAKSNLRHTLVSPIVGDDVNVAPVSGQAKRKLRPKPNGDGVILMSLKRGAKFFGNNYLEFHFGWEPLMKDIEASVDLFTNPLRVPYGNRVIGRGSYAYTQPRTAINWTSYTFVSHVAIRATVKLDNLNAYRLEQLGLLNPAVLAWEVIPFSFVVDWFVNIGDFLSSFTDFIGLSLTRKSVSHYVTYNQNEYGSLGLIRTYDGVCFERSLAISYPFLRTKPLKWPSVVRGATAVSLLTGFFDTVQRRR